MGNYEQLKQSVSDVIKTNGNQEITGSILQNVLLTIISTVGANATFAGIATPATNPGTPDGPVFYLASEAGTYTNFGGIELQDGLSVLLWNGSWSSQQIFGIDDVPTAGSNKLVKSGGVQQELALGAVYDVSAKNPTAGVNNDGKWESLSVLLSDANLNTLIPTAIRKGGMSIKFVQSPDNKYIQARCMAQNFTTDVTQWQGVDDEIVVGSENLCIGDGIDRAINTRLPYIIAAEAAGEMYTFYGMRLKEGHTYRILKTKNYSKTGSFVLHFRVVKDSSTGQGSITLDNSDSYKDFVADKDYNYVLFYNYSTTAGGTEEVYIYDVEEPLYTTISFSGDYDGRDDIKKAGIYRPVISKVGHIQTILYVYEGNEGNAGYIFQTEIGNDYNKGRILARNRYYHNNAWSDWKVAKIPIEYSQRDNCIESGFYLADDNSITKTLLFVQKRSDNDTVYQTEIGQDYNQNKVLVRNRVRQNGVWSGWTTHNLDLLRVRGLLRYIASEEKFIFFSPYNDGGKHFAYEIQHCVNHSELVYLDEWRLVGGGYYRLLNGSEYEKICDIMTNGENEFAMKLSGAADYTGGYHGDERIDISQDSYVKFFVNGTLITDNEMQSDFEMICDTFMYIQYSTLHETTLDGTTPITDHPIFAKHTKISTFFNGEFKTENTVKFVKQEVLNVYHSGLFCMGKGAATYAILPNAVATPLLNGSMHEYYADNNNTSKVFYWNTDNQLVATVDSRFLEGLSNDSINNFLVWDRPGDSKYYRRCMNMNQTVEVGKCIRAEQEVKYIPRL